MNYEIKDNRIIVDDCLDSETVDYINTTIYAFKGSVESIEWQSKNNRCIVYNYEPFVAFGFNLTIILEEGNVHNDFILFHLTQRLNDIEHLEKCLSIAN